MITLNQYLQTVNNRFQSGISREHSYRGDFENLLRGLLPDVEITNEPANVTDCGNPDFVLTKKKIPIGYIEAKDIGKDLNSKSYKEQFDRYKKALDNLIITDYVWFQFYQNGALVYEIKIAEITENGIQAQPENFSQFENLIQNFCSFRGQTIKSAKKLAEMMAAKARLFQNILENAISSDEQTQDNTTLQQQYKTFKQVLIHDLNPKSFADIYAQTLAYGMFAARSQDETIEDFSRQEAAELVPKSNPFLRKLFSYIAGVDIDNRIKTPVDNLAEVFRAANVNELLSDYGKSTQTQDPIIHFYETFLAEYDPKLRKARGVWYTPEPVVNFIVRAVDDILKTEFGLSQGLADTSKVKVKRKVSHKKTADLRSKMVEKEIEQEVHKVQILDPATGTGTFLAAVIKHIYNKQFKAMQGAWSGYVENDLIPRLNGFELLMASYAMAHLKMDLLLKETGYTERKSNKRFNIFLTNSLEEHHKDTGTLFSSWLSDEANEANRVKRDTPVMCIIGNPPYAVSSTNKSKWIESLISDYKRDLKEKSYNSLSDDYVKFIRYGQHYVQKNGDGILAYISNNSFIDGITHRQMRKNLLETFDKIYILDLHGNAKKKEVCPDGSTDQNVFDIMQGVSINIFIKTGNKKANQLGKVFHSDLYGKRELKYPFLFDNAISTIKWKVLENQEPHYFFVHKDFKLVEDYNKGFLLTELMKNLNPGVESGRDDLFIDFDKKGLKNKISSVFNDKNSDVIKSKFKIKDTSSFKLESNLESSIYDDNLTQKINYRPFDLRFSYYDNKLQRRASYDTFKHIIKGSIGLVIKRGFSEKKSAPVFIVNSLSDRRGWSRAGMQGAESITPLYLYQNENEDIFSEENRKPNLNKKIVTVIADRISQVFTNEKADTQKTFAPIDILDYIYAVMHSPTYREKYKAFLKIDFPRVPYPKDVTTFWQLVALGKQIREFHLLESPQTENYLTSYPKDGDNIISRKMTKNSIGFELSNEQEKTGKVWINDEQYFDGVPEIAWSFYIGGYQPAQKWLKDRKGRELSFEDIIHYQKIIVALTQTHSLMQQIDKIEIE